MFCPCIVYGKTSARLNDPALSSYDTVNSDVGFGSLRNMYNEAYYCAVLYLGRYVNLRSSVDVSFLPQVPPS